MSRSNWTFKALGSDLANGAKAKLDFHAERVAYWEKETKKIKDKIVVEAAIRGSCGTRQENTKRLTKCNAKLAKHAPLAKDYESWYKILSANPSSQVDMNRSDYDYFFTGPVLEPKPQPTTPVAASAS
ncbi:MAG: hypothetical protein WCK82_08375 [Bacteroidota bacterium]